LSLLSCVAGLYLSFMIFPAMEKHLFASYRAAGSVSKLTGITSASFFKSITDYLSILSNNLVWPEALALLLIIAGLVTIISGKKKKAHQLNTSNVNKTIDTDINNNCPVTANVSNHIAAAILFAGTAIFVFLIVSLSAPFQTARYIVPFFPVFILGYVAILKLYTQPHAATIFASIITLLVLVGTFLPPHVNQFHEDYVLDDKPSYLYDEIPLIIVSTHYVYKWKNLLLYKNIGAKKKLFITECSKNVSIDPLIPEIMAKNGSLSAYVFVDSALQKKPRYPKIGYYGFFEVYKTHLR